MQNFLRLLCLVFPLTGILGSAERTVRLPGVLNPQKICVFENQLVVVDDATLHLFSLKDYSKTAVLGRKGEGPGELKVDALWHNSAVFFKSEIFVDSLDKVLYFSRDGKLLREMRKPSGISQIRPVGKNFVGLNLTHMQDDLQYLSLILFDPDLNRIRELARQVSPAQSAKMTTEVIFDSLFFTVLGDEIFVEKSREGFLIEVFDSSGGKVREIKKDILPLPVRGQDRDSALALLKNDPAIRNTFGFENLRRMTKFIYPKSFPAISGLIADRKRLYVLTPSKDRTETECLVMDGSGRELGKYSVPLVDPAPFMARLLGVQFFTIAEGRLYHAEVDGENTVLYIRELE